MREIKIRAWDLNDEVIRDWKNLLSHVYGENTNSIFNDKSYILMQFTGRHDKDGKEIYAGDITSVECDTEFLDGRKTGKICISLSEIIWINDSWGTRLFKNVKNYPGTVPFICSGLKVHATFCKVIGNIYENPELLKGE